MKFFKEANNYWQTLRRKKLRPCSRRVMWGVVKLALLVLRLVCKLIDSLDGVSSGD